MTQSRLNHLMLLHIHKEECDKLNLNSVLVTFVSTPSIEEIFLEVLYKLNAAIYITVFLRNLHKSDIACASTVVSLLTCSVDVNAQCWHTPCWPYHFARPSYAPVIDCNYYESELKIDIHVIVSNQNNYISAFEAKSGP